MFKNSWSNKLFTGRKSTNYRQNQPLASHGSSKGTQDFLCNIVEEGSMEDLPKTFEQEEQYLNDCLKSIGSSVEDVRNSEVEEYDFDDFNSIASTASMLNLAADTDDRLRITSPPTARSTPQMIRSPPNGFISSQNCTNQTNGFANLNGNEKLTNYQKSLSRVENWDRLGRGGEDEDWSQVLIQAAEAGDLITVQNAVSHLGATRESLINARDTAGNTPLHKAAQCGKLQCLKWLVKRAPADAVAIGNHDDMTPAAMAIQYGQVECLEWLVDETNARQELENKNSFTLLHYAAKEGQDECLRFLLSYVSPTINVSEIVDSNDVTPAHLAAREGHLECLQTLFEFNSDITLKDREGCTPADCAFKAGQTGCGRYLVVVETCIDLSARLASCRKENEDLRNRLRVTESISSHIHMPDRPEVMGCDLSDSSSTVSMDSIVYPGSKVSKFVDTRRSSGAPDGESPKGTKKEGTAYKFQTNGLLAPASTPVKPAHQGPSRDDHLTRRRGSFPLTCWEKSNEDQTIDQEENKCSSYKIRNERKVVTSPSPRTPNCSTESTTKNPSHAQVHFEDSRGQHVSRVTNRNSPEVLSSVSSSRSQSPYRSDRSTASSTETVLLATPVEQHHLSYRDTRRHDHAEMTDDRAYIKSVHTAIEKTTPVDSRRHDQPLEQHHSSYRDSRRHEHVKMTNDKEYTKTNPLEQHRSSYSDSRRHDQPVLQHRSSYSDSRRHDQPVVQHRYNSAENSNDNNMQRTAYKVAIQGKPSKENITSTRLRNGSPSKLLQTHDSNSPQHARLSWHGPEDDRPKHSTANQARSTKERVNDFELLLADDSTNRRTRISWHGSPERDRLSLHDKFAHDTIKNNTRSPERRTKVSWGDERRSLLVPFRDKDMERNGLHHSPRSHYHNTSGTQDNSSFASSFTNPDEKPWYETEEVEL